MTTTPTILLDGIWGRPSRFSALRRLLESRCGHTEVFHYNSWGNQPFELLGEALATRIRQLDQPVNVIGFSMGGIVIRAAHWLHPDLPIRRAVFLNSPHRGTLAAYVLPLAGVMQMRPNSKLMRNLAAAPWDIPTLVTWCPLDAIIVPGCSANWPKASESIRLDVPMHIWPIWSKRVHQRIASFLGTETVTKETMLEAAA